MKKQILIVDDDSSSRYLIDLMLNRDYNVETASCSNSVIEKIKNGNFDMILLDITLGKTDSGVNALNHIRSAERYQNVPVIAVNAHALPSDREKYLRMGFTEYIAKTFAKTELLMLLEAVFNKDTAIKP